MAKNSKRYAFHSFAPLYFPKTIFNKNDFCDRPHKSYVLGF